MDRLTFGRNIVIFVLVCVGHASSIVQRRRLFSEGPKYTDIQYETRYFEQQVDHFNYVNQDTFQQRYLIADQFWDPQSGPIFFYTGNEGDITMFCNNTGLMWDWAPEFKALIVFAEHRYYGTSLPYGKKSYQDLPHLGYLTSEQALADFVTLIDHIKTSVSGANDKPVIAFGGSYGGMLAAWFRIKYPYVVQGSLAASAPIWMFGDLVPCEDFNQRVTKDFQRESETCVDNIRQSWEAITTQGQTASGLKFLSDTFRLCQPLTDAQSLKGWLSNSYVDLAMIDYPYAADFLEPLPAWPVKVVCESLSHQQLEGTALIQAIAEASRVYFNYTGNSPCLNLDNQATKDLGDQGWDFQACTEMVMPICTDGEKDMFEASPWDYDSYAAGCKKRWGTTPNKDWILQQYGGKNIDMATNIIFSNGDLDPWRVGGVLTSLSDSLVAIRVPNGAHHLDLRGSNPMDPPEVIQVRTQEKQIVQQWIQQYWDNIQPVSSRSYWPSSYVRQMLSGDVGLPNADSLGDTTIIVGTLLFALGAGVLLFYLSLAQNIRRHLVRKPCEYTEICKTPTLGSPEVYQCNIQAVRVIENKAPL